MNTVLDIVAEYPFILVVGLAVVAAALKKDLFALLQQWFRKRFNVKDDAHIEDIPAELHELNLSQMFVTTVKIVFTFGDSVIIKEGEADMYAEKMLDLIDSYQQHIVVFDMSSTHHINPPTVKMVRILIEALFKRTDAFMLVMPKDTINDVQAMFTAIERHIEDGRREYKRYDCQVKHNNYPVCKPHDLFSHIIFDYLPGNYVNRLHEFDGTHRDAERVTRLFFTIRSMVLHYYILKVVREIVDGSVPFSTNVFRDVLSAIRCTSDEIHALCGIPASFTQMHRSSTRQCFDLFGMLDRVVANEWYASDAEKINALLDMIYLMLVSGYETELTVIYNHACEEHTICDEPDMDMITTTIRERIDAFDPGRPNVCMDAAE